MNKICHGYNQSRNVRYLGIVTCHIESDTCLVATANASLRVRRPSSAKAHACSATEMTVASVLLIAQALFWVVDDENRSCSFQGFRGYGQRLSSRPDAESNRSQACTSFVWASFPRRLEIAWHQPECWRCEREPFRSIERNQADASCLYFESLSLTHSISPSVSLSLSLSASVCCFLVCLKMTNGIGVTTWFADVVVLKKTVWTVSLGLLSAAKFRPSSDTSGALPLCHWWLVRGTTRELVRVRACQREVVFIIFRWSLLFLYHCAGS